MNKLFSNVSLNIKIPLLTTPHALRLCVRASNGKHLREATETHSGRDGGGGAQTRRALDVDRLINRTSGETEPRPPWDERNGSADPQIFSQRTISLLYSGHFLHSVTGLISSGSIFVIDLNPVPPKR